jgi:hypothetical protein
MHNFGTLRQSLLRELTMSRKKERERERERNKEREKNAIYSGHLHFCLQTKGSARTPLGPKFNKWPGKDDSLNC